MLTFYDKQRLAIYPRFVLILMLMMNNACGPAPYRGRLAPPPEWTYSDMSVWQSPIDAYAGYVVYGRGQSAGHQLIAQRRALAETEAVNHARAQLKMRFMQITGQSQEQAEEVISQLAWALIALPVERFFDPEKNTQHVLVQITRERFVKTIEFEIRVRGKRSDETSALDELIRLTDQLFTPPAS